MDNVCTSVSNQLQPLWCQANWYRALTLTERLLSSQKYASDAGIADASPEQKEKAQRQYERWRAQAPFEKENFFAQRLAQDGLTEEKLLSLLLESSESLRRGTPPKWLITLDHALNAHSTNASSVHTSQELTVYSILLPLVEPGRERLRVALKEMIAADTDAPFELEVMLSLLETHLPEKLLQPFSKTFVLEMHVARIQERLQGETSEERFQCFLKRLCEEGESLALFEEYCVLTRYLVEAVDRWVECSLEFAQRLCADWQEIRAFFAPRHDIGQLVDLKVGAGDTHRGGRSVTLLAFASGLCLVYKPRPLAIDTHVQEVLSWLTEHGVPMTFRTLAILNKGEYGWIEYISPMSCSSAEQIRRFYERQGGYLAILYALGGTDMHSENIIAAGEYPVIVDLETLFQPEPLPENAPLSHSPAKLALSKSVLPMGFLPQKIQVNQDGHGIDISGLGCYEGQQTSQAVSTWAEDGTDEIRLVREPVVMEISQNRPRLQDQPVRTLDYLDAVLEGFTAVYRFLMTRREEWLALLPRFASDPIRFLPRPSKRYDLLLTESFYPNLLRDALRRERFLDRLWLGVEEQPTLARLIPAERADLLQGDIPLFTTYPESRDLYTSRGERIADLFVSPGMQCVKERVLQLSEQDLERQCWIIRASFSSLPEATDTIERSYISHSSHMRPQSDDLRTRCLNAAEVIRERLRKLAIVRDEKVGWLAVNEAKGPSWVVAPSDTSLYHGVAGILLFLGYLNDLQETRHDPLVDQALNTLKAEIAQVKQGRMGTMGTLIGAFTGMGSCIYLLSHLGTLWNDPSLFVAAEELVALLPEMIEKDSRLDIIAGAAGCIMSLLSLYEVVPSHHVLKIAIQCGDHLLKQARQVRGGLGWLTMHPTHPLTGFSHGTAGIAMSLYKLASVSGEERFFKAAQRAMQYERSLFSVEHNNWLDLHVLAPGSGIEHEQQVFKTAWCHGAPGIGLGRMACLEYVDDLDIRTEIEHAVKTTMAHGFGCDHPAFGSNHSLCHGDFGNLETLLVAAQVLRDPTYQQHIEDHVTRLLDHADARGWVTGVPLNVETPGLMTGLAGIGYELLRIAEPERVPSVLLLASPVRKSN